MSFDRVAPFYRCLETIVFGHALQRARVAMLERIPPPARVLIVGEGNGRFLEVFVRRFPECEIDCVDASAQMLALARTPAERAVGATAAKEVISQSRAGDRVHFIHSDIRELLTDTAVIYDLVVTHFVLDCFNDGPLCEVVGQLATVAGESANWLIADFTVPETGLARLAGSMLVALMYRFFQWTAKIEAKNLTDPAPLLEGRGFRRAERRLFFGGSVYSDLWRRK